MRMEMGRLVLGRCCFNWSHSKTVAFILSICFILSFSLLHMAVRNSSPSNDSFSSSSESSSPGKEQRYRLYDKMERDLYEHGAAFLKHGETSQSLSLSDLFTVKNGSVSPVLKAANPPVRANVLYLSPEYAISISEAVKNTFSFSFDKEPVQATENEIEAEVTAVRDVSQSLCPLNIVLDRVVLTSSGVLLGCWQVVAGTGPITIRSKLRTALPHAPQKQLYDAAILHTSFVRLLGLPKDSPKEPSDQLKIFHESVDLVNSKIRGFEAIVSELWYVEEFDVLALAL